MQPQHVRPPSAQRARSTAAAAQPEALSDKAVVTLLGGLYVGGLTTVVGALYLLGTLF
jgi:hypothetical protein